MAISKETIRQCVRDLRDEIEAAQVNTRAFTFEPNGNYVFVGVRHVGKSYMLYQRVKELLASGVGWDEILFVNFEDERLAEMETADLNTLLEMHLETYGKRPYIFLDEIQNVPHWDKFVRRLADAKYRLYVTGSNAKMLSKDVATTLGGRFFIVDVYPYSFREYLAACHVALSPDWHDSTIERGRVMKCFNDYFYFGGLPEIVDFQNKRSLLSSLYQKIYLGDICKRNQIKSDRVLSILIKKMAESVKQPLSFNRLRNIIVSTGHQVSVPTTVDYVDYAIDSWLVIPVENEVAKLADKESQKKYYFVDNGILNLFLINPETSLLENLVAVELCRRYGREQVSYYKGTNEIDFVVENQSLAIQVSYSIADEKTRSREVAPLKAFVKTHPDYRLLLLTFDEREVIEVGDSVVINALPLWEWLLNP